MLFIDLSNAVRSLWAKTSGDKQGHGLLTHMIDVAAVAEAMLMREPAASRQLAAKKLGLPERVAVRWVAALAGLHDFGKAISGFQAKWQSGRLADEAAGLLFNARRALNFDKHSLATAALLSPLLEKVTGASVFWCQHVVGAVSAHHGFHFTTAEVEDGVPVGEGPEWKAARSLMLEAFWATLAPQEVPESLECDLPIVNWLAGLTSAADWIASNPRWFPLGERGHENLQDYHRHAIELANQALPNLGWHEWRPLLPDAESLDVLLPRIMGLDGAIPRALQVEGDLLLRDACGPTLLLVEAPMGEGKTELAFLAHLRLQAANQHRGLFVAMPTQATGNALFKRAKTFLSDFSQGPLDLQLVHGGAAMSEDLAAMREVGELQSVGDEAFETLSANAWFGQRSRPLLSPYGVGTVDQALYAVLNVKHHFVRLWGLSNRVVVLDEIHAYDAYTSRLIVVLLRWLKALDCSVILMSATLPRARSQELLRAWGADGLPPDLPYPRLFLADNHGVKSAGVEARDLPTIQLRGIDGELESLAQTALDLVSQGGCGALIVNTVGRAQALYRMLKQRLAALEGSVDLLLFHSRFPADERQQLEVRVRELFGKDDDTRPGRALLVATQVAEQSLDIDFDFMLSDLAPVDLLLQRAGRLHRHDRTDRSPAHRVPVFWVAGLLPDQVPDLKKTAWGLVYEPYVLYRTWAALRRESRLVLPGDIDRLVQGVYDESRSLPDDVDDESYRLIETEAHRRFLENQAKQSQQASNIVIDPAAEVDRAYGGKPHGSEGSEDGHGLVNATRLVAGSTTIVPVLEGADGLWHLQDGDEGFDPNAKLDAGWLSRVYCRQISVRRHETLESQSLPTSFADHALLRNMRPLVFRKGWVVDASLKWSLSPEMGLGHITGDPQEEKG
ncbi:CRISPR-associated endonuclease/helicase Cas3 [Roseateles asaccharophilus]|uniref:CRISPR-associated helicase Cas3' n=1 Tax=Roseateles asaccharophilus TaxID=582607 RepID=UPI003837B3ED